MPSLRYESGRGRYGEGEEPSNWRAQGLRVARAMEREAYNTNYVFVKAENFERGLCALEQAGYEIL